MVKFDTNDIKCFSSLLSVISVRKIGSKKPTSDLYVYLLYIKHLCVIDNILTNMKISNLSIVKHVTLEKSIRRNTILEQNKVTLRREGHLQYLLIYL